MTQFPYKTPDASAFMYNGKDDISEYTGNPNISIPLLTLTERDISIPVILNNKGDAIKVQEESSWVGLGWNLSIGGCINYVPAGSNDITSIYSYDWKAFEPYFKVQHPNVQKQSGYAFRNEIYNNEALKGGLGEPDFYNVSILGKNFSFFIHPSSTNTNPQFVILGDNNEKFSIEKFNGNDWVIKDCDGYSYYFEAREYCQSDAYPYISAWYLTTIISPKDAHVSFNYSSHKVKMMPTYEPYSIDVDSIISTGAFVYSKELPKSMNDSGTNIYFENAFTQQMYLDSITSDNWMLEFMKSKRTDIEEDPQKLDYIKLTSKLDNKEKRKIHFNYSYFNGIEHDNIEENTSVWAKTRLKLNSIDDGFESDDMETYRFVYDEHYALPWKRCLMEDYWGFYNGLKSREVSPDYLTTGMLTKIYYPTGGSTEYTFEPHEFDSKQFPLITKIDTILVGVSDSHNIHETISKSFSLNDDASGTLTFYFSESNGKLDDLYNKNACIKIMKFNNNGLSLFHEIKIDPSYLSSATPRGMPNKSVYTDVVPYGLSPGIYVVMVVLPKDVEGCVRCVLNLKSLSYALYSIGGGVRVKRITNYDEDNKKLFYVDYSYNDGKTPSGKLLYPMQFVTHEVCVPYENPSGMGARYWGEWSVYRVAHHNWNGNVATAFSNNCLGGKTIGYSLVTKNEYDEKGDKKRTITSCYSNDVRYDHMDDTYDLYNIDIGKLLTQTIIDNNGHIFKQIHNTYAVNDNEEYMVAAKYHENWIGPSVLGGYLPVYPECDVITYKYFNQWQVLSSSVENTFDNNHNQTSETKTIYGYDGKNKCISSINVTDNSGYTKTNLFYYDTSNPTCFAWSVPIKQQMYYNNARRAIPAMKTIESEYGYQGFAFVPFNHKIYHDGSNLQDWVNYKYDKYGNIIEEVKNSVDCAVYLWGYNKEYPIAKIIGASYNEIQSWATPSLINSIAENNGTNMVALLTELRDRLKQYRVQLTTYTYIPLVGIQTIQNPNGETNYFDYDSHGRLIEVRDNFGNVTDKYSYHFKNH